MEWTFVDYKVVVSHPNQTFRLAIKVDKFATLIQENGDPISLEYVIRVAELFVLQLQ